MGETTHTQHCIELLIEKCGCTAKAIGSRAPLWPKPGYSRFTYSSIAEPH